MMMVGLPLFKSAPFGKDYAALMDTLGDEEHLVLFSDYLQERGA
jgi:hypothetical protein